ncbi:MAG: 16S rRNA (adenine(1518)-N(6)/adenine(1519)-N(6))-dimethyltransferase RsmA [bacterium]|nr:16S rRNA (adenine(1518)-N(6)/adenine(1519)-N(6))-dimethyltransferase RsmA [bacterium]
MSEVSIIDSLPSLQQLARDYGLFAKKSLGQHFLFDLNLTRRIARHSGTLDTGTTIEVGPGPGGLTRALLLEGAQNVVAVEKDRRCVDLLQSLVEASEERLTVLEADALDLDIKKLGPPPYRIVSNLPYNISTALLVRWLKQGILFESFTLMFQKEVADRLFADPSSKAYGRLSILTQFSCKGHRLFDIPPSAFVPPPKVMSSVVHLRPNEELLFSRKSTQGAIEKVAKAAFGQRRKMLRVSLKALTPHAALLLENSGITPTARAEELSVEQFDRLAAVFTSMSV